MWLKGKPMERQRNLLTSTPVHEKWLWAPAALDYHCTLAHWCCPPWCQMKWERRDSDMGIHSDSGMPKIITKLHEMEKTSRIIAESRELNRICETESAADDNVYREMLRELVKVAKAIRGKPFCETFSSRYRGWRGFGAIQFWGLVDNLGFVAWASGSSRGSGMNASDPPEDVLRALLALLSVLYGYGYTHGFHMGLAVSYGYGYPNANLPKTLYPWLYLCLTSTWQILIWVGNSNWRGKTWHPF